MSTNDDYLDDITAESRDVLAAIADSHAADPPFSLRSQVLNEALRRRPSINSSTTSAASIDTYQRSVDTLDAVLGDITGEQWGTAVIHSWNIGGVVTHLRVVDELAAATLCGNDIEPTDIGARTERSIAASEANDVVRSRWQEQTRLLRNAFESCSTEAVNYLGFALSPEAVIVDRAFETWLHTQDIRAALGLSFEPPDPPDLATLTDLGARMLAKVVNNTGSGSLRLVLDGTGSWLIPLAQEDIEQAPTSTATLDPIDFCLLIADRLAFADLQFTVKGDEAVATAVLSRAPELARL